MRDKIQCRFCGRYLGWVNGRHLATHGLTEEEYLGLYPGARFYTDKMLQGRSSRMKERHKDPVWSERMRKLSSETMAETNRNRDLYPAWVENQSRACSESLRKTATNMWKDPVIRAKLIKLSSERMKERWRTDPSSMRGYYDGAFRSRLEESFAELLTDLSLTYTYEKHSFSYEYDGRTRSYIPDFYVEELRTFYEVKPKRFVEGAQLKSKLEAVRRAGYKIEVVTDELLKDMAYGSLG